MKHTSMTKLLRRSTLVVAMLALLAGTASAQTIDLVADEFDWNGIPMWGFMDDSAGTYDCEDGGAWAPGPTIEVDAATTPGLTINLRNCLADPVSIMIPGQPMNYSPVFVLDRVRSFTKEVLPSTTDSYTWSAGELKAGTFLYSSGTHPAKQVHMGLYGAVVVNTNSATGEAYPGVFFDRDIVVVLSEVDPDLHSTAATAKALDFMPKYFLVNGDAGGDTVLTDVLTVPTPAGLNSRVLLRFVNAGLKNYAPTLLGEDLEWVAEDGNLYPHARRSYSAFLAAGKTMDAIWVPITEDRHALYDRRMHMSTDGDAGGGMRAFLDSAFVALPVADITPASDLLHHPVWANIPTNTDPNTVGFDGTGSTCPVGTCTYEWALVAFPVGASQTHLTGEATATPTLSLGIPGTYTAQLVVTDSTTMQTSIAAIRNVFTNLPPVAVAGADQAVDSGATVFLDGSESYDPDTAAHGDVITYAWSFVSYPTVGAPALTGATTATPSFTADAVAEGDYVLNLEVSDGELTDDDAVTVTASVHVNQPPDAVDDFYEVAWKTADNPLNVLQNDSDPDGTLVQSTLTIVTAPTTSGSTATVVETSTGSGLYIVWYTPKPGFKGSDFFTYEICDNELACSEAEVRVNVVKP